ncbi:MAG TPA: gamma-glutamylcyclotransferase family protein [Kofleriaceae bacterium]|nr:gamma-glutamylcyclotransferase family protein [Kofleriaceae bacterium]
MAEQRRRSTGTFEAERTTGTNEVVDRLFVYGTMRAGQTARSLIANQIARCVNAHTEGSIYAFPMGYPGYTEDGRGRVNGEVLWLTELAATFGLLDAYEGQDFARVIRKVALESGEEVWAWVYTLSDPQAVKLGTLIEDGDWVRYWTEQT